MWKGKVYSWHGGIHSSWWVQNRNDKIVLQGVDINLIQDVFPEHFQCAVYIRKKRESIGEMRLKMLNCLGGRSNIYATLMDYH